ncbi:MAG TPA: hypothetical protein VGL46_09255 [Pseudonocardiaceae bacterium]|jgi:hypothetical protein
MIVTDHFQTFAQSLIDDRNLVFEMSTIIYRAQAVNIDFREATRRRLEKRIRLLLQRIDRECRLLDAIDLCAAGNHIHRVRELAQNLAYHLDRARESTLAFDQTLYGAYRLAPDREPHLTVLVDVAHALDASAALVDGLGEIYAQQARVDAAAGSPDRRLPIRASRRIASLAVRLLPWDERLRYLDEYVSELDTLTQDETLPPREQIRHALRLLTRTPALLFALHSSTSQRRSRAKPSLTRLIESRSDI